MSEQQVPPKSIEPENIFALYITKRWPVADRVGLVFQMKQYHLEVPTKESTKAVLSILRKARQDLDKLITIKAAEDAVPTSEHETSSEISSNVLLLSQEPKTPTS